MSKIRTVKRICEHCGKEFDFPIYDSVNVTLDPELKDKVFSGDIFNCECPHCKKINTVTYPFTYHDMEKKFMVLSGSVGDLLINREEMFNGKNSPLRQFPKITEGMTYCGATGYYDFLSTVSALDAGLDWRVAKLCVNYLCYLINKHLKEEKKEPLDIKYSTIILEDSKPIILIGYGDEGKQNAHDFPMDLYNDMFEDFKDKLDEFNPFIFDDDALDAFMNRINKDISKLKESKVTYYLCKDEFGNGFACLCPDYIKDVKIGDMFVVDNGENSIAVVKVLKDIETDKFHLPFSPRDFDWFKYRHSSTLMNASQDSEANISNPELLETLISIKNNKNKGEINFPNELFDTADVILAIESTVDVPLEELLGEEPKEGDLIECKVDTKIADCKEKGRRMIPVYLDTLDFPDEKGYSKFVMKFNDIVRMFLMNPKFKGIMINPEDEKIILNRKVIENYIVYKTMDNKEFMNNLIMSLTDDEIKYLDETCYNFIKGANVDGLSASELDKKYNKDSSLNDAIFGIGYRKLGDIVINRFATQID